MKNLRYLLIILTASTLFLVSCSKQPVSSPPVREESKGPKGSITAVPNPVKVCGEALTGSTGLSWTSEGTTEVEVHVDSPAGALFSRSLPSGSATTGNWVVNGQVFYLQDVSKNEPLTPLTTIATVTVNHTKEGCPPQ